MAVRAARFHVVYTFGKSVGSQTRTETFSSTSNLPNPDARSEMAVAAFLKTRHPGSEITILSVEFQDNSGKPV